MPKLGSEVVSAMPKFAAGAFPAAIAAPAFAQSEVRRKYCSNCPTLKIFVLVVV